MAFLSLSLIRQQHYGIIYHIHHPCLLFSYKYYNANNIPWTLVPTGTGNPGKMGRHFPVREESGNFTKTRKVRAFYPKYWKNQKKLYWKIEKILEICQQVIVKNLQICYHNLNKNELEKILENWKKYRKSHGKVREICQSEKVGNMYTSNVQK